MVNAWIKTVKEVQATVPKGTLLNDILEKAKVIYEGPIEAPINKNQKLAKLKIIYDDEQIGEYDLLALNEVKKVNIFSRLVKSLNYLIWGDV